MFREEPIVEEDNFASYTKHRESHSEVEESQKDFYYEATNDHVIPTKVVDLVFLDDGNKPINVVVPSDVSDSMFDQETIYSSI